MAWEVAPTTDEVLDYRFQVLRSEGPRGPWDERTGWFTDKYEFLDNAVPSRNASTTLYYLIRVKHAVTGKTEDFGPTPVNDSPDLIALEVRRTWEVRLHELVGVRSWLFPVRTFGTTCRNCYSKTDQQVTSSQCLSCFGTGFVRGFHQPIELHAQFMPIPKGFVLTPSIRNEAASLIYLGAYPDVKVKDLIIRSDNTRMRVANVKSTQRLGMVCHQEIVVTTCGVGDIEFKVPVDIDDLLSTPIAEERNFKYRTTVG